MSGGPRWVEREALLRLHEESLREFGGASGIRDQGLLESALARLENKFLYEPETGLHRLAAAYCFGLAKNHAFVDGNKRAALTAVIVFLRANGLRLRADALELELVVLEVVSSRMDEDELGRWLMEHTVPGAVE